MPHVPSLGVSMPIYTLRDWEDSALVGEWIVYSPLFSSILYEISLKFFIPASFHFSLAISYYTWHKRFLVASLRSCSLLALHFWIELLLMFNSLAVLSRFLFF